MPKIKEQHEKNSMLRIFLFECKNKHIRIKGNNNKQEGYDRTSMQNAIEVMKSVNSRSFL